MARFEADLTDVVGQIERLGANARENIERIAMAGAKALEDRMRGNIQGRRHVRTGDMLASVGHTGFAESYMGGSTEVYPLDEDRYGNRNATKAYVTNYGRGRKGRKLNNRKSGDHFITGDEAKAEAAAQEAMSAEADAILEELGG